MAGVGRSISWPAERLAEQSREWERRKWINLILWPVLILSSILTGFAGRGVVSAASWVASVREGHCRAAWYLTRTSCCQTQDTGSTCDDWVQWSWALLVPLYLLISVACAGIAAFAVSDVSPEARMSGIPQLVTFTRGYEMPGLLTARTLCVKLIGMGLTLASGLWLGIEAPMVHIASCFSGILATNIRLGGLKSRTIVSASAAAGISVAFGAPVGGLLFVLETFQPQRVVLWQGFVCATVAALAAGSATAGVFNISNDRVWHGVELIPFAAVGAFGGLYGAFTIRANTWIVQRSLGRRSENNNRIFQIISGPVVSTALVALVTALVSLPVDLCRKPHSVLLRSLFAECKTVSEHLAAGADSDLCGSPHVFELIYTFFAASTLLPVTFGLPIPSGILFPSIVVGALFGRLSGLGMQQLLEHIPQLLSTSFCPDGNCITPGVYAVVGAGAVLTGVSRLTVSSVVILFELTGALAFVIPLMVGVMVSKWVGDAFGRQGIYDVWIDLEGLPSLGESNAIYPDVKASAFMTPASELEFAQNENWTHRGVPVVDAEGKLVDFLGRHGSEPTAVLTPNASLLLVVDTFKKLGVRVIVFCDRGYVSGLATRKDVIEYLRLSKAGRGRIIPDRPASELEYEIIDSDN